MGGRVYGANGRSMSCTHTQNGGVVFYSHALTTCIICTFCPHSGGLSFYPAVVFRNTKVLGVSILIFILFISHSLNNIIQCSMAFC